MDRHPRMVIKNLCVFLSLGAELEVQLIAAQKEIEEERSKQFIRASTAATATDKALELTGVDYDLIRSRRKFLLIEELPKEVDFFTIYQR